MKLLGIHIAGFLILAIFLAIFIRIKLSKHFFGVIADTKSLKSPFRIVLPATLAMALLLFFYVESSFLPFKTQPRIYKKITSYIDEHNIKLTPELTKAFSYCGVGNLYRCSCELYFIYRKNPDLKWLGEIGSIIREERNQQYLSEDFLK
jgi:hypothetical protein